MVRFWSVHRDPLRGTHLHLTLTSHRRTTREALDELREHRAATAPNQWPVLFYDFGPAEDHHPLTVLTQERF